MKCNITNEYYRRIQKILRLQLNGLKCITASNVRAVSIVRCSAGILKWMEDELKNLDRKLLNIYWAFQTQGDVDRLYFECSEGGWGLKSVGRLCRLEDWEFEGTHVKSDEKILKEVHAEEITGRGKKKDEIRKQRQDGRKEKALHGMFWVNTTEGRDASIWT